MGEFKKVIMELDLDYERYEYEWECIRTIPND